MPRTSKTPPHSIEAERAVLGAVLRDNEALVKVQAVLASEDFYQESHRLIFTAMREMASRGEPVDLLTLSEARDTRRGNSRLPRNMPPMKLPRRTAMEIAEVPITRRSRWNQTTS